jgi:hypothetical protein
VFRERFENTVKISSAPTETVAVFVPRYPWNEQNIDSIKTFRPKELWPRFGNIETSRREVSPEVFELREEEVNVSFLYNRDKNSLVAIQGFSN